MHRVVTLNTLCSVASIYFATQHNRFFSEPPTFFEENDVIRTYEILVTECLTSDIFSMLLCGVSDCIYLYLVLSWHHKVYKVELTP